MSMASHELTSLIKMNKIGDIIITKEEDIYDTRQRLFVIQHLKNGDARFILWPNYTKHHATALLSILEKGTDKLLLSVHINSESHSCDDSVDEIRSIFEKQTCNLFEITDPEVMKRFGITRAQVMEKYDQIKKKLCCSQFKIDAANRIAYLADGWLHLVIDKNEVDIVHNIDTSDLSYQIYDRRPVTVIDVPTKLQTAEDDMNCALYTFNTMQAIVNMLQNKDTSEVIYKEALKIGHGTDSEKKQAEEALTKIFRDDLKPYLPCYFNSDGSPKSESELKDFHLKQRWELGSRAALDENYLTNKHFLPN